MRTHELSPEQQQEYAERGFTILRSSFSVDACQSVIEHMMALHDGRRSLEGFEPRETDNWDRTHNQHLYDPMAMNLLLSPQLRQPLKDCLGDEPDGVQTMYFWKGSEQHWHQDQYYLPACMSAWIALVDVGPENGTIWVQSGSHRRKLIVPTDLQANDGEGDLPSLDSRYDAAMDALVAENSARLGLSKDPVVANTGDVVLFHGTLIHRGGPVGMEGSFRHVMANHYIPHNFDSWPFDNWPRISFDGERRAI